MKKATLLFIGLISISFLFAQSVEKRKAELKCVGFGISRPLRELFTTSPSAETSLNKKIVEGDDLDMRPVPVQKYSVADGEQYREDESVRQSKMGERSSSAPLIQWQGQTPNLYPPDPTGAAGINEFVQIVNACPIAIYNKTNGAQIGTVTQLGSLWNPAVPNAGDPVVLYDKYANRWFLSQFSTVFPYHIYIAISTSSDPTGTYYTYTFSTTEFPDYQKFSVWADGYYMTSNQGTDEVICFERDLMIAGNQAARAVSAVFAPGVVGFYFCPLPANADGQLPPLGTPCPFVGFHDNGWGGGTDKIKIWSMAVDWLPTIPTATISGPDTIPTSPFDASSNSNRYDIAQPGTSAKLDAIGGILTYRAQWRKWTGYNTLVINFSVKVNGSQRGIRWCELRQDALGTWSLYQEGTYAPDAATRWLGSIAMDDNGAIALCYAKVDAANGIYPSLAYCGRLSSDPLGTMPIAETVVISGTSSLAVLNGANYVNRFGDYFQTTLDPVDGSIFWHTGEYIANNAQRTRIYSFHLPGSVGIKESNTQQSAVTAFQSNEVINVIATNLDSNDELSVDLFDISGRQINHKMVTPASGSFQTTISIAGLARGNYLVRVGKYNSSFQKVNKVTIQ